MLILAGADTWLTGGNAEFAEKAREFLDAGVPVAAICGATGGLAAAGLLDDRRHTSNAKVFVEMMGSKGGDLYVDEPAVTDRGLITATAAAPVEFAREIFAELDLYEPEVLASWYKLYGQQDPAGYHELMGAQARNGSTTSSATSSSRSRWTCSAVCRRRSSGSSQEPASSETASSAAPL